MIKNINPNSKAAHPHYTDYNKYLSSFYSGIQTPALLPQSSPSFIMTTFAMEALLVSLLFVSAMFGTSDGAWCVCRPDISDSALQKTLDYACGAGADCAPINQNGACYNPNTVKSHCSYAVNSYYQRKGQTPQACDFAGTATLTPQDPSANGCAFPASSSAAGTSTGTGIGTGAGVGGTPVTGSGTGTGTGTGVSTPIGITPGTVTPSTVTPTSSGTGGVLGGLGPSGNAGNGFSTDSSGQILIQRADFGPLLLLILSVLAMLTDFDWFID